jgi:hypothetical protein
MCIHEVARHLLSRDARCEASESTGGLRLGKHIYREVLDAGVYDGANVVYMFGILLDGVYTMQTLSNGALKPLGCLHAPRFTGAQEVVFELQRCQFAENHRVET